MKMVDSPEIYFASFNAVNKVLRYLLAPAFKGAGGENSLAQGL